MDETQANLVGQMDQFGMAITTVAPVVAQYYRALLAAGVPIGLTMELVRDQHALFWRCIYWPDQAPPSRPDGT